MATDWFRSIVVLGAAFLLVLGMTLGLAALIVPGAPGVALEPDIASPDASGGPGVPVTPPPLPDGAGGSLVASGDLVGVLVLDREDVQDRYALVGNEGRVIFEGMTITQIGFDGWSFFPEPTDCTITPGEGDPTTGLGTATIACENLVDIRDKGVASLEGEVRLAANVVGLAPDLPPSGGTADVGDERWEFDEAFLLAFGLPAISGGVQYNLILTAPDPPTALSFTYDVHTHAITLASVERDEVRLAVPAGACDVTLTELGRFSPQSSAAEMHVECAAVDVQGLGTVPISVDVVVHVVENPA